jgi:hypothetical protein
MIDTLFWLSVACATVAALMNAPPARALVAGAIAGELLRHSPITFDWSLWFLLDLLVILFIVRRGMSVAEWAILALFPVSWVAYTLGDPARYLITSGAVIVQMLLTLPLIKHQGAGGWISHGSSKGTIRRNVHG